MLRITEIPFGTTTGALMDSIVAAADKGKIKIQKIEDNTAANADILVHLPAGADPETTRDALYAFSDCELTISPNACVIVDGKPQFMGVSDILKRGERLIVLVAGENPPSADEAVAGAAQLAPLWRPKARDVHRVDALPRLGTGKRDLAGGKRLAAEKAG